MSISVIDATRLPDTGTPGHSSLQDRDAESKKAIIDEQELHLENQGDHVTAIQSDGPTMQEVLRKILSGLDVQQKEIAHQQGLRPSTERNEKHARLVTKAGLKATISIFIASLDATILQYVQSAFSTRDEKPTDQAVNVFLYLSLALAVGTTLSFAAVMDLDLDRTGSLDPDEWESGRIVRKMVYHGYRVMDYSGRTMALALYSFIVGVLIFIWADMPVSVAVVTTAAVVLFALYRAMVHIGSFLSS